MPDARSSSLATQRLRPPGLPALATGDAALQQWSEFVREAVDVLAGARNAPFDRAVLLRDLERLGFDVGPLLSGGVQRRDTQSATINGRDPSEVNALAREVANTTLFQQWRTEIDGIQGALTALRAPGSNFPEARIAALEGNIRALRTALDQTVFNIGDQITNLDNEVKINATLVVNGIRSNELVDVLTGVQFGLGVPWTNLATTVNLFGQNALYTGGVFRSNDIGKFASVHMHTADGVASVHVSSVDTDVPWFFETSPVATGGPVGALGALGNFDETDLKWLTMGLIGGGQTAGFFMRKPTRESTDVLYWAKLASPTYALETYGPARINGSLTMGGQLTGTGTLVWNGSVEITGQLFVNGTELGTGNLIGTKIWSYTIPGNPLCYSTPIKIDVRDAGGTTHTAVVFMAWDKYLYALKITDGTLIWRYQFDDVNYGRAIGADVNGDTYNEIIGASHDGTIRCLTSQGAWIWTQHNAYYREGGFLNPTPRTLTDAGAFYIEDTAITWAANSFQRGSASLNAIVVITSGVAAGKEIAISADRSGNQGFWLDQDWDIDKVPSAGDTYYIRPRYESDIYYQHAGTLNQESGTWYLYIGGFDNQMVKLNASTGAVVWRVCALENIEPFPLIATLGGSTRILFASVDGYVYCLNTDGTTYWTSNIGYPLDAFLQNYDIDADAAQEILVSSRSNRVHILNGTTGVQKSQSPDTQGDLDSRPVVVDSTALVVAGDAGHIQRFTYATTTMTQDWDYAASAVPFNSSPVRLDVDNDGTDEVIAIDMTGLGFAMDMTAGTLTGRFQAPGAVEGTPLAGDYLSVAGEKQLIVTALGGVVEMYTFPKR